MTGSQEREGNSAHPASYMQLVTRSLHTQTIVTPQSILMRYILHTTETFASNKDSAKDLPKPPDPPVIKATFCARVAMIAAVPLLL